MQRLTKALGLIGFTMPVLSKRELTSRLLGFAFTGALIVGYAVGMRYEPPTQKDLRFDEEMIGGPSKSEDLARDIKLMWKTVPTETFPVSPVSAIKAAGRVFGTVELVGKTTNEVFAIVGHNKKSNDSGYNFPFWPVERGTLVYRFDCGDFGWQFNLKLDESGRVTEIERKGIH